MNILKKLASRSGKIALTALQAVGLTAVVGAGAVAAYQFLGSSSDDNTAFNPAGQYNPGEVVYVSGANTGSYAENVYRGKLDRSTGEPGSSMRVSAKTLKLLENQELAERAAQEMAENEAEMAMATPIDNSAYQLGQTEGLGMGANAANEQMLANSPMGAMTKQMADIKNVIANAQQQAQAQAKDKEGKGAAEKGAPTLASATPGWRSGSSSGGGANNGGGSTFVVQNSGKNAQGGADVSAAMGALESAQHMMNNLKEGSHIRAKSSFGNSNGFGKDRNATITKGRDSEKGRSDLEFFTKRSIDVAKNKSRHQTEANVFIDSYSSGGVMMLEGEQLASANSGSKDFSNEVNTQLGSIPSTIENTVIPPLDEQNTDQNNLLWGLIGGTISVFVLCVIISAFAKSGWPAILVAAFASIALLAVVASLEIQVGGYIDKWGQDGWSLAGRIVPMVWAIAGGLSWIFPSVGTSIWGWALEQLGITSNGALWGLGATVGAGGGSIVDVLRKIFNFSSGD